MGGLGGWSATGQEALDILNRQRPEAVVLDLGLPDDKGGEVLHRLLSGGQQSNGRPAKAGSPAGSPLRSFSGRTLAVREEAAILVSAG